MKPTSRILLAAASLLFIASSAQAVPVSLPSFGAWAQGQDLEPVNINIDDGGAGSASAAVSFTTFDVEAMYDPASTYLPILKAQANGLDATIDDDRTSTEAVAYEIFTSSIAQTINLGITLDSTVFANPPPVSGPTPSAGVILDVYVFLDPFFETSFCGDGERMSFGTYICGDDSGVASSAKPGLNRANIGHLTRSDGNGTLTQTDTLTFDVAAGQEFGIYAELKASAFQGTADAFNTATMQYLALDPNSRIDLINPVTIPAVGPPSAIPLPGAVWMFGAGLLGLYRFARKKTTT